MSDHIGDADLDLASGRPLDALRRIILAIKHGEVEVERSELNLAIGEMSELLPINGIGTEWVLDGKKATIVGSYRRDLQQNSVAVMSKSLGDSFAKHPELLGRLLAIVPYVVSPDFACEEPSCRGCALTVPVKDTIQFVTFVFEGSEDENLLPAHAFFAEAIPL